MTLVFVYEMLSVNELKEITNAHITDTSKRNLVKRLDFPSLFPKEPETHHLRRD